MSLEDARTCEANGTALDAPTAAATLDLRRLTGIDRFADDAKHERHAPT
jgi:hypothetical protein